MTKAIIEAHINSANVLTQVMSAQTNAIIEAQQKFSVGMTKILKKYNPMYGKLYMTIT